MSSRRALHFVMKVGDRCAMMDFLKGTLGMKVLRHEEFDQVRITYLKFTTTYFNFHGCLS